MFSFIIALFFAAVLRPLHRLLNRVPGPRSISALLALVITNLIDRTRTWLHNGPLHPKSSDLDKIADNITKGLKSHESMLGGNLRGQLIIALFQGARGPPGPAAGSAEKTGDVVNADGQDSIDGELPSLDERLSAGESGVIA